MAPASESFQGWTLAETLERTADPELWRAWIAAKGAWEKVRVPTPSGASAPLHRSPRDIQALRHAADDAFHQVKSVIWQHLTQERLTAIGSRGNGSEPPTSIHSAAWQGLIFKHWEKSIVEERGSKTRIFNVRVFPILHAPDVHVRLVGCSVSDVFRRFVIEDPEVVLLGKRVSAVDELNVHVFREGYYPGWANDFKWPLALTASDLASRFVAPFISYISDPACPWRIRKLRCDRHLEQTAAMVPPSVVIKDGMGGRRFARSFSWSTATERLMNAIFVVINSELVQLSLQVDCVPD